MREIKEEITEMLQELIKQHNMYGNGTDGFQYDYDTYAVKVLLKQALQVMEETARCLRPEWLPEDMPWNESMNPVEEFDPYVFQGNMSVKDFKTAQNEYLKDKKEIETENTLAVNQPKKRKGEKSL